MDNFWKNKRVLITGAFGFVGKALSKELSRQGAHIFAFNSKDNLENPLKNLDNCTILLGDVTNTQHISDIFKKYRLQYCYHLAAQAVVEIGSEDPTPTFEVNIKGTWNVLEAARQNKVEGVIIASTSHVYGKNTLPYLEEYFPRPSRPYETSKACADMIAQTYANYYDVPVAIARFVNTYGPGDNNSRIVPKTIQLLMKNRRPELFSDYTTRDYLYIDDAIDAYLVLGKKMKSLKAENIIFNFGTGNYYKNDEIINKIIKIMGKKTIKPIKTTETRKQEIKKQYVSIAKAQTILRWSPKYSIDEGLQKTIDWYIKK
jgi:CDP-glucose 4,6-dehydratase